MLTIPPRLRRSAITEEEATVVGAVALLEQLCGLVGVDDLSHCDLLDVGCGVKFTQAILNHDIPIRSYTGVDVYGEMIEFLRANVHDPRFQYHRIDVRNELYNPDAPPMTAESDLGVADRMFDVICLYSVFTHLSPADYVTMLKILRRYIRPEGRLVYTLFVDELTDDGHGLVDFFQRTLSRDGSDRPSPEVAAAVRQVVPFRDVDPSRPLTYALYSREHAYELIDGTGWEPQQLVPPTEHAQHIFVCRPV
jgi:cyclopropane fatty-acyl-phospholipid synthase-like methyltransferase